MVDGDDAATDSASAADPGFAGFLERLSQNYNFDFREYKPASLLRRIRTRMSQVRAGTFEAYAQYLDARPDEHIALFNTILINVTGFFRDAEAWKVLAEKIVPSLVDEAAATRSLRVWSAGCASGEETYSIAILLAEHLGHRASEFQVKIYGTDVDEEALAAARHALYRLDQLKDVPDAILARHFVRDGQLWRVRRDLRRRCIFRAHNLAQAAPLSHIDLLVCRNVLIYFSSALQDRILSRFHYAVRDSGFLFLGRSESLLLRSRLFAPLNAKWRIFQRLSTTARSASAVLLDERGARPDAAARAEPTPAAMRVQRVVDALPLAVLVVDTADEVVTWNPVAEALFEISLTNAVGGHFRDLDVSDRLEGLRAAVEEVKARQASVRLGEVAFTRRNGEAAQVTVTIAPLFDAQRLVGVLVCAEDTTEHGRLREQLARITEQHATAIEELQSTNEELETTNEELESTNEELQSTNEELETTVEELQAANAELAAMNTELEDRGAELARLDSYHRGVVNGMEQGLMVMDRLGVVRTWNRSAERMWGFLEEQVLGRDFFALPLGEFLQRVRPTFERMLATGQTQQLDNVLYTVPGRSKRVVQLRIAPVVSDGGEIVGGIASAWPQAERPA